MASGRWRFDLARLSACPGDLRRPSSPSAAWSCPAARPARCRTKSNS